MHATALTVSLGSSSATSLTATLNPGASPYCSTPCARYTAGADNSSRRGQVCQYQRTATGTAAENVAHGVTCFPPLGCRADWNQCWNMQWPGALLDGGAKDRAETDLTA